MGIWEHGEEDSLGGSAGGTVSWEKAWCGGAEEVE